MKMQITERSKALRRTLLDLSTKVQALHLASAFSCIEIIDTIYSLFDVNKPGTDRFILSKGHGAIALYTILLHRGILSSDDYYKYCTSDGLLGCHPDRGTLDIIASTGSLGHGIGLAVGVAYSLKYLQSSTRSVYVIASDGELQEGSSWESMMMAANLKLNNLVIILDSNRYQSFGRTDITHPAFYPVDLKLQAFGFQTDSVNGHDQSSLTKILQQPRTDKPLFIEANTIKGYGVSFMVDSPIWHYRSPSIDELKNAMIELS